MIRLALVRGGPAIAGANREEDPHSPAAFLSAAIGRPLSENLMTAVESCPIVTISLPSTSDFHPSCPIGV
jgi:hypothetical protein